MQKGRQKDLSAFLHSFYSTNLRSAMNSNRTDNIEMKRLRRYRTCAFICVIIMISLNMFHRAAAGVLRSHMNDTFSLNATQFSTFSVMLFYPYVLLQLPAGVLIDRIGVRKVLAVSSLLAGLGILWFALSSNYLTACLSRLLIGIGFASAQGCNQKLNNQWFREDRIASAIAVTSFFGYIGTLCAQAPLAFLLDYFGWRNVYIVLSAISLCFAAIAWLLVRDRPQDVGLLPVNEALVRAGENVKVPVKTALKNTFRNPYLYPLLFALTIQLGTYNLFSGTWGVSYFKDVFHLTTMQASAYTTALSLGCAVFGLLLPVLSDTVRLRKIPLCVSFGISGSLWILLTYFSERLHPGTVLLFVMFLFGTSGCNTSQMYAMIREINDPKTVGVTFGACNMIAMSTSVYFPVIAGVIMDKCIEQGLSGAALYKHAFSFCAVLAILGFISVFLSKETRCNNIYSAPSESSL